MKTIKRPYTPVCDLELVLIAFLLFRDHSLPESNPSRRTQELYIIM